MTSTMNIYRVKSRDDAATKRLSRIRDIEIRGAEVDSYSVSENLKLQRVQNGNAALDRQTSINPFLSK
mgnify:CR=1 FL=1